MSDFMTAMDALATTIAGDAGKAENLSDKVEAFKALVPYYVQKMKHKAGDDGTDDTPTFDNFASKITNAEQGNGREKSGIRGN